MLPAGRTLRARRFATVHLAPLGCIDDIQCAVADKATVPIYYESRIAKLGLNASELLKLDADFGMIISKRILNKYDYPPDIQEEAVKTVLHQAELLCADWGE
jgi:hypothetical protein